MYIKKMSVANTTFTQLPD